MRLFSFTVQAGKLKTSFPSQQCELRVEPIAHLSLGLGGMTTDRWDGRGLTADFMAGCADRHRGLSLRGQGLWLDRLNDERHERAEKKK